MLLCSLYMLWPSSRHGTHLSSATSNFVKQYQIYFSPVLKTSTNPHRSFEGGSEDSGFVYAFILFYFLGGVILLSHHLRKSICHHNGGKKPHFLTFFICQQEKCVCLQAACLDREADTVRAGHEWAKRILRSSKVRHLKIHPKRIACDLDRWYGCHYFLLERWKRREWRASQKLRQN